MCRWRSARAHASLSRPLAYPGVALGPRDAVLLVVLGSTELGAGLEMHASFCRAVRSTVPSLPGSADVTHRGEPLRWLTLILKAGQSQWVTPWKVASLAHAPTPCCRARRVSVARPGLTPGVVPTSGSVLPLTEGYTPRPFNFSILKISLLYRVFISLDVI